MSREALVHIEGRIHASTAAASGVVGAAMMSVSSGLFRATGATLNLELLLGSFVTGDLGLGTWLLGFAIHLALGAVVALAYGRVLTRRPGMTTGILVALPHVVAAGPALAAFGSIHPLVPDRLSAPGAFAMGLGTFAVAEYLLVHLVFGAVVGALCVPTSAGRREALA